MRGFSAVLFFFRHGVRSWATWFRYLSLLSSALSYAFRRRPNPPRCPPRPSVVCPFRPTLSLPLLLPLSLSLPFLSSRPTNPYVSLLSSDLHLCFTNFLCVTYHHTSDICHFRVFSFFRTRFKFSVHGRFSRAWAWPSNGFRLQSCQSLLITYRDTFVVEGITNPPHFLLEGEIVCAVFKNPAIPWYDDKAKEAHSERLQKFYRGNQSSWNFIDNGFTVLQLVWFSSLNLPVPFAFR